MVKGTLEKGLLVLETLAAEAREFRLAEVAALTGLDKSNACRLLQTLVAKGYVTRDPDTRKYRIGLRTLELSASILSRMELRRSGITYLRDLSDQLGATTYIGVPHLGKVLIIETAYPSSVYVDGMPDFGSVLGLESSAMGKVLLSHMPAEEQAGVMPDTEEFRNDIRNVADTGVAVIDRVNVIGVAAPVRNYRGRVVASMGASVSREQWDRLDAEAFKPAVRMAAEKLSFAIGHAASRVTL